MRDVVKNSPRFNVNTFHLKHFHIKLKMSKCYLELQFCCSWRHGRRVTMIWGRQERPWSSESWTLVEIQSSWGWRPRNILTRRTRWPTFGKVQEEAFLLLRDSCLCSSLLFQSWRRQLLSWRDLQVSWDSWDNYERTCCRVPPAFHWECKCRTRFDIDHFHPISEGCWSLSRWVLEI